MLVFGAKEVLFKLDMEDKFELVKLRDLGNNRDFIFVNWTHDQFICFCILSGCDYLKNPPGLGIKKGYTLFTTCNRRMHAVFHQLYVNYNISDLSYSYREAFERAYLTFKYQRVFCPVKRRMVSLNSISNMDIFTEDNFKDLIPDDAELRKRVADFEDLAMLVKYSRTPDGLSFLGPIIEHDLILQIADCVVDPISKQPFENVNSGQMVTDKSYDNVRKLASSLSASTTLTSFFGAGPTNNKSATFKAQYQTGNQVVRHKEPESGSVPVNTFLSQVSQTVSTSQKPAGSFLRDYINSQSSFGEINSRRKLDPEEEPTALSFSNNPPPKKYDIIKVPLIIRGPTAMDEEKSPQDSKPASQSKAYPHINLREELDDLLEPESPSEDNARESSEEPDTDGKNKKFRNSKRPSGGKQAKEIMKKAQQKTTESKMKASVKQLFSKYKLDDKKPASIEKAVITSFRTAFMQTMKKNAK